MNEKDKIIIVLNHKKKINLKIIPCIIFAYKQQRKHLNDKILDKHKAA